MAYNWQQSQGVSANEKRQQHAEVAAYRAAQAKKAKLSSSSSDSSTSSSKVTEVAGKLQKFGVTKQQVQSHANALNAAKEHMNTAAKATRTTAKPHGSSGGGDTRERDEQGRYV